MSGPSAISLERLDQLRQLLELEAGAARQRDIEAREGKSAHQLEQDGVRLRKARIIDERAALYGKAIVTFGEDPNRPGHLARFAARPGSVVRIVAEEEPAIGVVIRASRGQLRVVFDAPPDLDAGGADLELSTDEVTARRLTGALHEAGTTTGRTAGLIDRILGSVPPEPTRSGNLEPFDDALNPDQIAAVHHGVYSPHIGLIHGPPGTGKTRVLVEVVRQCVARGERVLCLAASNAAVDHLALSVLDADPDARLIRVGHPARVNSQLESHTLAAVTESHEQRRTARTLVNEAFDILRTAGRRSIRGPDAKQQRRDAKREANRLFTEARQLERRATADALGGAQIIAGTLTGYATDLGPEERFDVAVIDEASQALTPAVIHGVLRARRVVLAGDHRQLPPTVISTDAAGAGLSHTAFDALMQDDGGFAHMLTVQHRMHEALMQFPSKQFYGGKLAAHETVAHRHLGELIESPGDILAVERPLDVIDIAGAGFDERSDEGASKANDHTASLVARLVRALRAAGLDTDAIGVITPYSAQVATLVRTIDDIEIDSVDGFQGREKDVIIFDTVRSNGFGEVGFLRDARRLNVAITRAKRKLLVIADSATLSSDPVWEALFDHAMAADGYRSVFELPPED